MSNEHPAEMPTSLAVNSRFVNIAPEGQFLYAEYIATHITLTYEPTTEDTRVMFSGKLHYKPANKYLPIGHPDGRQTHELAVDLNDKGDMTFVPDGMTVLDPHTGFDLSNVSLDGLKLLHKLAYNKLHNVAALDNVQQEWKLQEQTLKEEAERAAQQAAIDAGATPTAPGPNDAGYDPFAIDEDESETATEEVVVSNTEDPEGP